MKKNTELILFLFSCFAIIVSLYLVRQDMSLPDLQRVIFLNVGQGDSQILQSGRVFILQDAGPNNKAAQQLNSILKGPHRSIAAVLITHPETDHVGGLPEVLRSFSVHSLVIPEDFVQSTSSAWQESMKIAREKNIPIVGVSRGDEIRTSDLQAQVLWPTRGCIADNSVNECAMVSKIRLGGIDYLFTGDIGTRTERVLLSVSPPGTLAAQVLKVPHHGSKGSILPQFFSAVGPVFSVVQVGPSNSYGHGSAEILERLRGYTKKLWSTAQKGGVEVVSLQGGKQMKISPWE